MKLYTFQPSSNCRKAKIVADILGLELEEQVVNIAKGEGQDPAYLAINPNGKIPALVDGETKLWESNAIMAYLAGKQDTTLWPKSQERYSIMRWLNWEAAHFMQCAGTLLFENILKGIIGAGEPDADKVAAAEQNFRRYAAVLNGALEGKAYLQGDELTLADIAIGVWLDYGPAAGLPLEGMREIERWHQSLQALPAWQQNLPQM